MLLKFCYATTQNACLMAWMFSTEMLLIISSEKQDDWHVIRFFLPVSNSIKLNEVGSFIKSTILHDNVFEAFRS